MSNLQNRSIQALLSFLTGGSNGVPADIVFVTSASDFPAPVGGISILEEKTYLISAAGGVSIPFRLKFAFSSTVVTGFGRLFSDLIFTNASASANVINDTNISVSFTDIQLESPNAPLFDCVGGATSIFTIETCVIDNCADIGKIDSFVRNQINGGTLIGFGITGGLEFLGDSTTIILNDIQSAANSATPTFTLKDPGLSVTNLILSKITATLLTGTNKFSDINPTLIAQGLVADSAFTSTDPLGISIDNTTPNFTISRVEGIEDTRKIGSVSRAPGNVVITSIGVPVEVQGSWLGSNLSQFVALNPGIQYIGATSTTVFQVVATIEGGKAGSTGSDVYTGAIYNNDVIIAESLTISEISDKGGLLLLNAFVSLANLDHLTLYISNEDSTEDFTLTDAKISLFRVN